MQLLNQPKIDLRKRIDTLKTSLGTTLDPDRIFDRIGELDRTTCIRRLKGFESLLHQIVGYANVSLGDFVDDYSNTLGQLTNVCRHYLESDGIPTDIIELTGMQEDPPALVGIFRFVVQKRLDFSIYKEATGKDPSSELLVREIYGAFRTDTSISRTRESLQPEKSAGAMYAIILGTDPNLAAFEAVLTRLMEIEGMEPTVLRGSSSERLIRNLLIAERTWADCAGKTLINSIENDGGLNEEKMKLFEQGFNHVVTAIAKWWNAL